MDWITRLNLFISHQSNVVISVTVTVEISKVQKVIDLSCLVGLRRVSAVNYCGLYILFSSGFDEKW